MSPVESGPRAWSVDGVYLALDTSTPSGSVCVGVGSRVVARRVIVGQGSHSSDLIPAIGGVLQEAGADVSELAGVVVGAGPGSFTTRTRRRRRARNRGFHGFVGRDSAQLSAEATPPQVGPGVQGIGDRLRDPANIEILSGAVDVRLPILPLSDLSTHGLR